MNRRDLEQKVQEAFDGDESRSEELRKALLEDPEALDLWCDYALLESELKRHAQGVVSLPAKRRIAAPGWWLAAAAAVVLSLTTWLLFRGDAGLPAQVASLTASPESIVRDGGGDLFPNGNLPTGTPLSILRGVVRLDLPGGREGVIEGPTKFTLVSMERLEISAGLSLIKGKAGKDSFTVVTPELEVRGGGEFGIDLREDRPSEVHAFGGRVELVSLTGSKETMTLEDGEAASRVPGGKWVRKYADRRNFLKELPPSLPMVHLDFDRLDRNSLEIGGTGLGGASSVAVLHHPQGARLVPGVKGMALEMDGSGSWISTSWPGISGTAPRTVSLWCRIPADAKIQTAPPLALWGNPVTGWNRKFKFALFRHPDGRTTLRGSFGERRANGLTNLADDKWHHLAMVYRGNDEKGDARIEFYIDGGRELSMIWGDQKEIQTETRGDASLDLSIGRYELNDRGDNPFLRATIDELKIHAGALEPHEIRELAEKR
jgi:hypothetical protein